MRYRYRLEQRREKRLAFVRLVRRIALFALVLIALYTLFLYAGGRPQVSEESLRSLSLIPLEKTITIQTSKPIREIRLYAEQMGLKKELYSTKLAKPVRELSFTLDARKAGLEEGPVKLTLEVSSGFLLKKTYHLDALVDTRPPSFKVLSYTSLPTLGGTGAIKIKAEEEGSAQLIWGNFQYSLYPMGEGYYFGLFPIRLDSPQEVSPLVVFTDKAGNKSQKTLPIRVRLVSFKEDRISIDDRFIESVIYPLLGQEGKSLEPLEAFKRVNELWRSRDVERLSQVGKKSEPRVLWQGAFLQLPNSKVLAGYGDHRYYYYKGQQVSESRHMGFDFASVERALVPASNSGIVVFAGNLGIYGNTVIIDHGMGLMSLYGHLSEIHVKEGQFVKKGEPIGRTGKTGLALGDHLHFGVLVQGYEVNPLQWLDERWIRNNILPVLEAR